jgi:hypothetical protein
MSKRIPREPLTVSRKKKLHPPGEDGWSLSGGLQGR